MGNDVDWRGWGGSAVTLALIGFFYWQARRKAAQRAAAVPAAGAPAQPDQPSPAFAPSVSDSALPYPVRQRGWRLYVGVASAGVVVLAIATLAILTVTRSGGNGYDDSSLIFGALFVLVAAGAGLGLWRQFRPILVLYPDRLEYRGLTGPRTLARRDILGTRAAGSDRGGAWIEIVPVASAGQPIRIRQRLRDDDPVAARWFTGARDLSAEALAAARAAILADPRYGSSPREREARLKLAGQLVMGFSALCLIGAAWLFFAPPRPLWTGLLAAALTPVLGAILVWASDGLVVWVARPAHPSALAALAPALGVALWGLLRVHLIGSQPLWIAAAVCAVAGGGLIALTSTSARRVAQAIAGALAAGLLGYGLPAAADRALDSSVTAPVPVTVTDRRETHGRSTSYYLTLSPTLPGQDAETEVSDSLYDRFHIGDAICLWPHPGALNIRWFDIEACPPATPPPVALPAPTLQNDPGSSS